MRPACRPGAAATPKAVAPEPRHTKSLRYRRSLMLADLSRAPMTEHSPRPRESDGGLLQGPRGGRPSTDSSAGSLPSPHLNCSPSSGSARSPPPRSWSRAPSVVSLASHPVLDNSGQSHTRHRPSRGGGRHLDHALHMVILTGVREHQPTRDCIARRVTEGKTPPEARCYLKRYLAWHLCRALDNRRSSARPGSLL